MILVEPIEPLVSRSAYRYCLGQLDLSVARLRTAPALRSSYLSSHSYRLDIKTIVFDTMGVAYAQFTL